jgi:hypothetical protein
MDAAVTSNAIQRRIRRKVERDFLSTYGEEKGDHG